MTERSITFVVRGPPVPKARARAGKNGAHYTPRETRDYEMHCKVTALGACLKGAWPVADGPVAVTIRCYFPDARRRDLDNCAKSATDACNGVLWVDDSQIRDLHVHGAIDREWPRLEMTVRTMGEE
jgi:Holliday junction resolvase RusA-like endonuclease